MERLNRTLVVLTLVVFAGCAGRGGSAVPSQGVIPRAASGRTASDAASAMPGDAATALPGDAATAMPGATLACAPVTQIGTARCTIAINITIPPISDPSTPAALIPGWHPADVQGAYALPAANAGGTVAIVDAYDDPTAEADLAVYRAAFGLPPCTSLNGCFRKVNQQGQPGAYPLPNLGWAQEIALDVAMVSAVCPRCAILLVETDSALLDDLGAGVDTAAALGASAISNSYYAAEWANELAEDVHYRHPAIAITASSGDSPQPSYPAASPYVTAVGGTTLTGGTGAWHETAWTYGGRGCSAYAAKPAWQGATGCTTRAAVDVAAVADPQTGVSVFSTPAGGWFVVGGTSVGAPLIAAAYALSGNPAGPAFSYTRPGAFHALGAGSYDPATGLGSPNGISGL